MLINPIYIAELLIIIAAIALVIIKIVKFIKQQNRIRAKEQATKIEAEKAERLATEERRHQEILQAIRESGKAPEDSQK